jgi:hypothetical protein
VWFVGDGTPAWLSHSPCVQKGLQPKLEAFLLVLLAPKARFAAPQLI